MKTILTLLALANLIVVASRAADITVRHSLALDGARRIADAAVAYAQANGAPGGSIAIVDEGGHLLHFVRLDGSFAASANVSIGKARTAATFRKATKDFEDIINKGRFTMTALPPDFTPLQGGVPILHEGHVVGAIGVSGAKSAQQDEDIAKAGAATLAATKTAANDPAR